MTEDKFIVYLSKRRIVGYITLGLVLVLVGIRILINPPFETDWVRNLYIAIGILEIVFFGGVSVYMFTRLFTNKPLVILSEDGIIEQSSMLGVGLIKWEEVKDYYIYKYRGQKLLGIEVINTDIILNRTKGLKRMMLKYNINHLRAQINISSNMTNMKLDEIINKMNEYKNKGGND